MIPIDQMSTTGANIIVHKATVSRSFQLFADVDHVILPNSL
jgi:hypothetical protein